MGLAQTATREAHPQRHRPRWWHFDLDTIPAPLARYIVGIVLTGAAALALCLTLLLLDPLPVGINFVSILALYLTANLVPAIGVERGGHKIAYRFHEIPALIGLLIGPAYLVPIAALLSETIHLVREWVTKPHERFKIPFNAAHVIIVVGITVAIASVGAPPVSFIAATILASLVSDLIVGRAIDLSGGPSVGTSLNSGWQTRLGIPTAISLICSLLILVPSDTKISLALVPACLILAYKGADVWVRMSRDRDQWRKMEEISRNLVGELDEQTILRQSLHNANVLFEARRTEIILPRHDGTTMLYSLDHAPNSLILATPVSPDLALCPESDDADDADGEGAEESALTCAVPLKARDRAIGRVVLHWDRPTRNPGQRRQLAATFAHAVAMTLHVARSHEHQRLQAEAKAYEATHDTLTDLGNRAMLYDRGPRMLAEAAAKGKVCAIFVFDLDGFKTINDTLGHAAGDRVITEVGQRIRKAVRRTDLAVRLGGDEFAVLATDLSPEKATADSEMVVHKLLRELSHPVKVDDIHLTVEASIGIALQGQDGDDIETLYRLGDIAMYAAKDRGRGQSFRYQAHQNSHSPEQLSLASDLRAGIDRDEIVLHYQPQVSLSTGEIIGMEALARWQHPTLGMLGPDKFVPITEHSGLNHRFTLAVLNQAVRDHAGLRTMHGHTTTMSVNLSARNLLDQALPSAVQGLLDHYGVPANELVLEITETVAASDQFEARAVLAGLDAIGCQVSLDDFGTGYSTLADLHRNEVLREVKVDRTFVADVLDKDDVHVMVECIVKMAHSRRCRVVAEGVEDEYTLVALKAMGCDAAQGYHIARPMPLEQALNWAASWRGLQAHTLASARGDWS